MEESSSSTSSSGNNKKIFTIIAIIGIGLIGLILINRVFFKSDETSTATNVATEAQVSGVLNINGVIPEGATVSLMQRDITAGEFTEFKTIATPADGATWSFDLAVTGKTYEIKGVIKSSEGTEIVESDVITVTAPASNEVLTFNLRQVGLTGEAVIDGKVKVNGYYPDGATITVMGRSENVSDFQTIVEGVPAFAEKAVSYNKAVAGVSYEIVGYLYDSTGEQIGESEVLTVVAPAYGEVLTINSSATSDGSGETTGEAVTISGSIDLNGSTNDNSKIVIYQRPMGSTEAYQVAVDNVNPEDGATWEWPGAMNATWYDMEAVLKERQANGTDKDIASSKTMTVAAPAINVTFSINSGIPLPQTTPTPTATQ